jgi:hypothetical protein
MRTVDLSIQMEVPDDVSDEQIEGTVTDAIYTAMPLAGDVNVIVVEDEEED